MLFRNYLSPLSFVILCQDWKAVEIQSQNINQTIIVSIKRSRNIPVLAPDGLNSLGTHICTFALHWRHNGHDSVSNNQPHHCLLNRLFRRTSNKTSRLRVTGLCAGNSPETGEFPVQMASNAENVSIWWRHHGTEYSLVYVMVCLFGVKPVHEATVTFWLKTESRHDANFVVTGGTVGCLNDNFMFHQWRQSWRHIP